MWEKNKITQKEQILYTLVIISGLLYLMEGTIPRPLPWLKLGFANIVTIIVIYYFSFRFLIKFIFLRVLSGSLITGTIMTPSFFLSLSAALTSSIFMYTLLKLLKSKISPMGLSVAGASIHLLTQIVVVYFFIINDSTVLYSIPVILFTALITGSVIGYISCNVLDRLDNLNFKEITSEI